MGNFRPGISGFKVHGIAAADLHMDQSASARFPWHRSRRNHCAVGGAPEHERYSDLDSQQVPAAPGAVVSALERNGGIITP